MTRPPINAEGGMRQADGSGRLAAFKLIDNPRRNLTNTNPVASSSHGSAGRQGGIYSSISFNAPLPPSPFYDAIFHSFGSAAVSVSQRNKSTEGNHVVGKVTHKNGKVSQGGKVANV